MKKIIALEGKEQLTEEVKQFNQSLQQVVKDLKETVMKTEGVALSAPQIGVNQRVTVIDFKDEREPLVLVNPTLVKFFETSVEMEGCLSYPNVFGEVKRPRAIIIEAEDEQGQVFEITAEDFEARVILHEMDHLYGVSFKDKISRFVALDEFEEDIE